MVLWRVFFMFKRKVLSHISPGSSFSEPFHLSLIYFCSYIFTCSYKPLKYWYVCIQSPTSSVDELDVALCSVLTTSLFLFPAASLRLPPSQLVPLDDIKLFGSPSSSSQTPDFVVNDVCWLDFLLGPSWGVLAETGGDTYAGTASWGILVSGLSSMCLLCVCFLRPDTVEKTSILFVILYLISNDAKSSQVSRPEVRGGFSLWVEEKNAPRWKSTCQWETPLLAYCAALVLVKPSVSSRSPRSAGIKAPNSASHIIPE
jgi:hypothetical protein